MDIVVCLWTIAYSSHSVSVCDFFVSVSVVSVFVFGKIAQHGLTNISRLYKYYLCRPVIISLGCLSDAGCWP